MSLIKHIEYELVCIKGAIIYIEEGAHPLDREYAALVKKMKLLTKFLKKLKRFERDKSGCFSHKKG